MRTKVLLLAAAITLIAGCTTTRSISNSGYHEHPQSLFPSPPRGRSEPAFAYRGELSEFDVLGLERGASTSDAEIDKALDNARRVRLHSGDSILLIQSGAVFPDGTMVTELSKHFRVVPFSGVPPMTHAAKMREFESQDAESYSRSLRLAAARGGNDVILCYWGILESANAKLPTRMVSWVPVVRWVIPDEREHMRLRLKMALIDVRTGNWAVLSPPPVEEARMSSAPRRGVADQKLVEELKQRAFAAAATELLRRYSEVATLN